MTTTTPPRTIKQQTVELARLPRRAFITIDRDNGIWRAAFWRIRDPLRDNKADHLPSQGAFDLNIEAGRIPKEAKREAWLRRAGVGTHLGTLLDDLLDGERWLDADTTRHYLEEKLSHG